MKVYFHLSHGISALLLLVACYSCKKEDLNANSAYPGSSYVTRVTFLNSETTQPVGGLRIHYARSASSFADSFLISKPDGSISFMDYYSNSFSTNQYWLQLPFYTPPSALSMYNPLVLLKNRDDRPGNYLFEYYPVSQTDRLREYQIPRFDWALLKMELKQGAIFVSDHKDNAFYIKFITSYLDKSRGKKAEETDGDVLDHLIRLTATALTDTVVNLPVFAGLDYEIKWTVFEMYSPDIVPPGYDPLTYFESDIIKTGVINTEKLGAAKTITVPLNF